MAHLDIAIVGAGPTGLGAAWYLSRRSGLTWRLFERASFPGGLAASRTDGRGFVWDLGGHVVFSRFTEFEEAFEESLNGRFETRERRAWVHFEGECVPFPLQQNIASLPEPWRSRAFADTVRVAQTGPPQNFEEWARANVGNTLTDAFIIPYNRKLWRTEPSSLSTEWVRERVAPSARLETSWGPNTQYAYPKGGSGALWDAMLTVINRRVPGAVTLDDGLALVDTERRTLVTQSGEVYTFGYLISTIPLTELLGIVGPGPPTTPSLMFTSVNAVGLGLRGGQPRLVEDTSWMYFSDPDVPFHRVTVPGYHSSTTLPSDPSAWSLLLESSKPGPPEGTARSTLLAARRLGLIGTRAEMISIWTVAIGYAYPVPLIEREEELAKVLPWLMDQRILSRGRFGLWRYEVANQDHCFIQGWDAARLIDTGEPERLVVAIAPPLL